MAQSSAIKKNPFKILILLDQNILTVTEFKCFYLSLKFLDKYVPILWESSVQSINNNEIQILLTNCSREIFLSDVECILLSQ